MKLDSSIRRLAKALPSKQASLDFGDVKVWPQLPEPDQRSCQDALAQLLCQILLTTLRGDNEHE
jgi:hypothetical protein